MNFVSAMSSTGSNAHTLKCHADGNQGPHRETPPPVIIFDAVILNVLNVGARLNTHHPSATRTAIGDFKDYC